MLFPTHFFWCHSGWHNHPPLPPPPFPFFRARSRVRTGDRRKEGKERGNPLFLIEGRLPPPFPSLPSLRVTDGSDIFEGDVGRRLGPPPACGGIKGLSLRRRRRRQGRSERIGRGKEEEEEGGILGIAGLERQRRGKGGSRASREGTGKGNGS